MDRPWFSRVARWDGTNVQAVLFNSTGVEAGDRAREKAKSLEGAMGRSLEKIKLNY